MGKLDYLMENEEEAIRLDTKIDEEIIERQATWAGLRPGMRVIDIGCGSGKVASILHKLVQPDGSILGIDISDARISFAKKNYAKAGLEFKCKNILQPLDDLGKFDFVWVRFVLEYYRSNSFDVLKNISTVVKKGGILCLIDQDYNCLTHYQLSPKLEKTLFDIIGLLEKNKNFDPYIGRKLYAMLYDLGYQNIKVDLTAHLIYGELKQKDAFNWIKKVEVIYNKIDYNYPEYEGNYDQFLEEFNTFFKDPRRFTYTPVILCCGRKPFE
jgi:ubiquinone/menaquinone biosynthesis C-methylase UbiE